jgi:hypothetical protein
VIRAITDVIAPFTVVIALITSVIEAATVVTRLITTQITLISVVIASALHDFVLRFDLKKAVAFLIKR